MSKLFFCVILVVVGWCTWRVPLCALPLYSDWEDSRTDKRCYPLKGQGERLCKFLGIEFGKTLEAQKIKDLGTHELGKSTEYPDMAVRGHKELYDYSEHFPAVEIKLPKVFRKFKRGWVFLSPVSKRVIAIHFLTEEDETLTRQDANQEILRSFSLIVDAFPELGFEERELGMPPLGMMLGGSDYICARATTRSGFPEWDFTLACYHGGYQVGLHVIDVGLWIDARKEMQQILDKKREREDSFLNNSLR